MRDKGYMYWRFNLTSEEAKKKFKSVKGRVKVRMEVSLLKLMGRVRGFNIIDFDGILG